MSDRSRESADPPHIDADAVARKTFSSSFRGYDTDEVRAFLLALAEEVRAVNEHMSWLHVQLVAAEERATAHVELDEDRLTSLLGEETTRVLASAREAAAAIRSRAESDAERVLSQASEQATAMRSDAMAEAIRHRERAETAAMAEVEAAKAHGRQPITDAQALRERVLADLSRRRNAWPRPDRAAARGARSTARRVRGRPTHCRPRGRAAATRGSGRAHGDRARPRRAAGGPRHRRARGCARPHAARASRA